MDGVDARQPPDIEFPRGGAAAEDVAAIDMGEDKAAEDEEEIDREVAAPQRGEGNAEKNRFGVADQLDVGALGVMAVTKIMEDDDRQRREKTQRGQGAD